MIYDITLKQAGIAAGILLLVVHLAALLNPAWVQKRLKALPRSRAAGTVLLAIAAVWSFLLVWNMDLGEFSPLRRGLLVAIVILTFTTWRFVEEFLAVRALGILALLAAEPLLEAAFLRPEESRLLLVLIAYIWAIKGIFWVGMPFLFRDQVKWISSRPLLWRIGAAAGVAYAAVLLVCSVLYY